MRTVVGTFTLLLLALNASAAMIVIDPDAYAAGSNLSTVSADVRISEWSSDGQSSTNEDVFALQNNRAASGSNVFGHGDHPGQNSADWRAGQYPGLCASAGLCSLAFDVLRVDFAAPTSYAELWSTTDHFTFQDGAYLSAFRADNSLIDSCYLAQTTQSQVGGPIVGGAHSTGSGQACGQVERTFGCADPDDPITCYYGHSMFIDSAGSDIAYLVFGGNGSSGTLAFADRLSFEIPEGSTLALFLAGLGVLFVLPRSGALRGRATRGSVGRS